MLAGRASPLALEARGASQLAVAQRHIRALSTARAGRGRLGDFAHSVRRKTRFARLPSPRSHRSRERRERTSPFQSARTATAPPRTATASHLPNLLRCSLRSLRSSSTVRASSDEPSLTPFAKTSRDVILAHESARQRAPRSVWPGARAGASRRPHDPGKGREVLYRAVAGRCCAGWLRCWAVAVPGGLKGRNRSRSF